MLVVLLVVEQKNQTFRILPKCLISFFVAGPRIELGTS